VNNSINPGSSISAYTIEYSQVEHKSSRRGGTSKYSYLCTYDLYRPVRNAFDAGSIHYLGKWEGVEPWKLRVF
jgi:hypothetical protein